MNIDLVGIMHNPMKKGQCKYEKNAWSKENATHLQCILKITGVKPQRNIDPISSDNYHA